MYIEYEDITDRISEVPRWWLDGVPRYCDFSPEQVGVYAREAALVLVEGFDASCPLFEIGVYSPSPAFRVGLRAALAAYGTLYVGDPPNYKDRAVPHHSAVPIKILQYWSRSDFKWTRESEFEGPLADENHREISPPYQLLAADLVGLVEWDAIRARRDVAAVARALALVGCSDTDRGAQEIIYRAVIDDYNRELSSIAERARSRK